MRSSSGAASIGRAIGTGDVLGASLYREYGGSSAVLQFRELDGAR